jgi:hypothetical protein
MPNRYIPGNADAKREFARVADALNKPIVHDWGTISSDQVLDVQVADANTMVLAANVDLTIKTTSVPDRTTVRLFIKQDATGGRLVTSWTGVTWLRGAAPVLQTAANGVDIIELTMVRFGSSGTDEWIGVHLMAHVLAISGTPSTQRLIEFQTSGAARWRIRANANTESGANVGSDLAIDAIADDGSTALTQLFLRRSNGAVNFPGNVGFNGTAAIAKPTVTGSRGGNAALASLLTALANYGLITDSSS